MRAEHINITLPLDLKMKIDAESKRERIGRSPLIQKALKFYLEIVNKKRLKHFLVEGYSEMSKESERLSKDFEKLDSETLEDVY